jgi:hypothetical protein
MAEDRTGKAPLKVGLLVGREWSFPPAFIEEVNRRDDGVIADYVRIGGSMMDEAVDYRVIIDRISHEVPYYRSYLKNAALQGVKVVNDPFMWSADDKFFDASLATRLGVASPKTVVLPNHSYVPGIVHNESLRNLVFPIDWQRLVDAVGGFPVVLKDAYGGGWRDVYICHSMEELWYRYDESGLLTMVMQEFVKWDNYARCMVLGQEEVRIMKYKPGQHGAHHYFEEHDFSDALYDRLYNDSLTLCRALNYDMNTVEYAIQGDIPYAIDFMNPAPDMDINSLGQSHFQWMVTHMADMAIRLAKSDTGTRERYHWGTMTAGSTQAASGREPEADLHTTETTTDPVFLDDEGVVVDNDSAE